MTSSFPSEVPFDWAVRKKYLDLPFPLAEYRSRIRKIRRAMEKQHIDALVIAGSLQDPGDLVYAANYIPFGRAAMVIGREGEPTIVTAALLHGEPINSYIYTTWVEDLVAVHKDPKEFAVGILNVLRGYRATKVGIVGMDNLSPQIWDLLSAAAKRLGWRDFWVEFSSIKSIHSPAEIALLREVSRITAKSMEVAVQATLDHKTEQEVAAVASKTMFEEGAHDRAFSTIINAGPRAGLKHTYPSSRKIQDGDLVYLDMGAMKYGYQSDMSRTVVVGKATKDQKLVLNAVLNAYTSLLAMMKPGTKTSEIQKRAKQLEDKSELRDRFAKRAYLGFFVHHAIATSFYGVPSGAENGIPGIQETVLKKGMSFAFEPMTHILDFGTVVFEDYILITDDGAESLTKYPLIHWR